MSGVVFVFSHPRVQQHPMKLDYITIYTIPPVPNKPQTLMLADTLANISLSRILADGHGGSVWLSRVNTGSERPTLSMGVLSDMQMSESNVSGLCCESTGTVGCVFVVCWRRGQAVVCLLVVVHEAGIWESPCHRVSFGLEKTESLAALAVS